MAAVKKIVEKGAKILAVATYAAVCTNPGFWQWQLEKKISTTRPFYHELLIRHEYAFIIFEDDFDKSDILVPPLKNQTPPPSPKCYFSVSFLSLSNPWIFHANHAKTHKIQMWPRFFFNSDPPIFNIFWVLSANLHTRGSIEVLDNDDWH